MARPVYGAIVNCLIILYCVVIKVKFVLLPNTNERQLSVFALKSPVRKIFMKLIHSMINYFLCKYGSTKACQFPISLKVVLRYQCVVFTKSWPFDLHLLHSILTVGKSAGGTKNTCLSAESDLGNLQLSYRQAWLALDFQNPLKRAARTQRRRQSLRILLTRRERVVRRRRVRRRERQTATQRGTLLMRGSPGPARGRKRKRMTCPTCSWPGRSWNWPRSSTHGELASRSQLTNLVSWGFINSGYQLKCATQTHM